MARAPRVTEPSWWQAPGAVERIAKLWNEVDPATGKPIHSAAKIGAKFGVTKNAFCGFMARHHVKLELAPRPKPAEFRNPRKPPPAPLALPAVAIIPPVPVPANKAYFERLAAAGRVDGCVFPIGHPGKAGFHYCDVPISRLGPYCDAHRAVAYQKPARQNAEADA